MAVKRSKPHERAGPATGPNRVASWSGGRSRRGPAGAGLADLVLLPDVARRHARPQEPLHQPIDGPHRQERQGKTELAVWMTRTFWVSGRGFLNSPHCSVCVQEGENILRQASADAAVVGYSRRIFVYLFGTRPRYDGGGRSTTEPGPADCGLFSALSRPDPRPPPASLRISRF